MTDIASLSVVVDADTSSAESSLQRLSTQVNGFGQSVSQGFGLGAGMAAFNTGLQLIGSGFAALKGAAVDFNQTIDSARASMGKFFTDTQSLNNSIADLNALAAKTPFAFEGLLVAQQRTIGAARSADELKKNMDAITVVAANTGRVGTENMERISLALGQIQTKGHLAGGEMLQLTEAGVNMGQILAKHFGVTTAAITKMTSEGKISAQDVFEAMREYAADPRNRTAMDGLAKTWEGAWSTISDVGRSAIANTFRPLFDLMTDGANALATFLQSADFQTWAEAARIGFSAISDGVKGILTSLQPLGETLQTVFQQFTAGDFSGAFNTISTALGNVFTQVVQQAQAFTQEMFGAGSTLIGEYANGILSGAEGVLQGAIDAVASMIASFLIGNSPPEAGPLANIREGGANVIMAWGEGAADAVDAAVKPVAEKISGNISELKVAGRDADAAIREIGGAIHEVEGQSRDLKYTADDIKTAYDDQISAIDDQIKGLQNAHDVQRDREKLEINLEEIQLRQAEIAAMGDPVLRAQLQTRLESLKASDAERKNKEALADAEKALGGSEKDRLKAKLDAQKLDQQEAELRARLKDKDTKPEDKTKIKEQLQELELRRQIEAADAKDREEAAARRVADAQAKKEQLTIQEQISGLVDKSALADIKSRQEAVKQRKEELTLQEQADKAAKEMALGPLKDQKEALTQERDALLKPLQEQLKILERQKATMTEQRQELQDYKAEIASVTSALQQQASEARAAQTEAKAAQTAATKAAKESLLSKPSQGAPEGGISYALDAGVQAQIDKAKESGAKLATSLREGFVSWFTENPIITAATITGVLFGAGQGASIGAAMGSVVPVIGTAIGGLLGAAIGAAIGGIAAGQLAGMVTKKLEEIVGIPATQAFVKFVDEWEATFRDSGIVGIVQLLTVAVGDALSRGIPKIAQALAGWANAFLDWARPVTGDLLDLLSKIVDSTLDWIHDNVPQIANALVDWAVAFAEWAITGGIDLLNNLAALIGDVLSWIGEQTKLIAGALLDWATEFVQWLGPHIPELLTELGKMVAAMVEWMAQNAGDLIDALAKWAGEFVAWVAPKIPPLLAALAELLASLIAWTVTDALPAIVLKLAQWGLAFVQWVNPRIIELRAEVGLLLVDLLKWMAMDALPAIVLKLAEWGLAFLGWVAKDVLPYIGEKLEALYTSITNWITAKVTELKTAAKALGDGMIQGIEDGMTARWGELETWITDNIGKKLPEWMQKLLGIHSPSTVFHEIGQNLIQGLIDGMDSKSQELIDSMSRIGGHLSSAILGDIPSGEWADLAKQFAKDEGVPADVFARQIDQESGFDPTAGSPAGAYGIAQFMPGTGNSVARQMGVDPDEFWASPALQLKGAAKHMHDLLDMFDGDIAAALVGYNAGPGGAMRWLDHGQSLDWLEENIPESRQYLKKILGYAKGGWAGLHGPELAMLGERGPEYVIPHDALRSGHGGGDTYVDLRGAQVYDGSRFEDLLVNALDRANRRGRLVKVTS